MKKLLSLLLVLVLCFGMTSCIAANVNYADYSVAKAAPKMEANYSNYGQKDFRAFLDKLDAFAAKLTAEVYADSDKQTNVCISPVSVYMALALTVECTTGDSRAEILDAVGVTYDEVKRFTKVLYALANREYGYEDFSGNEKLAAFEELANSIWADDGVSLKDAGVETLADDYNCDLFRVDFGGDEGERAIADYIKKKTHGMIDGRMDLPATTLITLINTFYLKDVWNTDGDDLPFTKDTYTFRNADGSTVKKKLLEGYYFSGKAYDGEGYTSFYTRTDHGFTIKFLVPDEGRSLAEVFTAENIHQINNVEDYGARDDANQLFHRTRVFFPEYEATFDGDLATILAEDFGIRTVFDEEASDFSGITESDVYVDAVIHKCALKVNKKGIEGAAVTAVVGGGAGAPIYQNVYHDYIVDRAFGFILTDGYGTVLFSGAVNKIK